MEQAMEHPFSDYKQRLLIIYSRPTVKLSLINRKQGDYPDFVWIDEVFGINRDDDNADNSYL